MAWVNGRFDELILILREFRESDWPEVLAYQQDPRYLRFNPWTERTPAEVQAFVQMFLDQ